MTSITSTNSLSSMLGNAFTKFDGDRSKTLDRSEFSSMYEVLKPGIAVDKDKKPTVSEGDEFKLMDHNSDGQISKAEMDTTSVLMPAGLTDDSLGAMIEHLKLLDSLTAKVAAAQLSAPDLQDEAAKSTRV